MQLKEPDKMMKALFAAALRLSGRWQDAEELTSEVLLAAVAYPGEVENQSAWMYTVLRRRFYDRLRQKYRHATVSLDTVPEPSWDPFADTVDRPEEAEIRREVAYLSDRLREVIVRHYFYGEKVRDIAGEMALPAGTVMRRLSEGREQMRKGMENMEVYTKQSYAPEQLDVSCSGTPGLHDEPWSLVADDLLRQNICIAAYDKPVTPVEIARMLGIPAAYVEDACERLCRGELLARQGNRVFTDFMITTPAEMLNRAKQTAQLLSPHFPPLWEIIGHGLDAVRAISALARLPEAEREKCMLYAAFEILSCGVYSALYRLIPGEDVFPQRPDGGSWIAHGIRHTTNMDDTVFAELAHWCYGGRREARFSDILGVRSFSLYVYDAPPEQNRYQRGKVQITDEELCMVLYLLHAGIPPHAVAADPLPLRAIPHLADCGILRYENDRPVVDIPVLSGAEYAALTEICRDSAALFADALVTVLSDCLEALVIPVPAHLKDRISPVRQYAFSHIPVVLLQEADTRGLYPMSAGKPPMLLVVEK